MAPPVKRCSLPFSPQEEQHSVATLATEAGAAVGSTAALQASGRVRFPLRLPRAQPAVGDRLCTGEKNAFSKILTALGGYLHSEGKLQNN